MEDIVARVWMVADTKSKQNKKIELIKKTGLCLNLKIYETKEMLLMSRIRSKKQILVMRRQQWDEWMTHWFIWQIDIDINQSHPEYSIIYRKLFLSGIYHTHTHTRGWTNQESRRAQPRYIGKSVSEMNGSMFERAHFNF